jgi:DNA-binding NarL/FixJ family response regulator
MNASSLAVAEPTDLTDPTDPKLDPFPRNSRRAALPPANENSFSPRERQVVELLHTGLTRKEVAYELGLNDATVRVHLWHARFKIRRGR